ncbi:MAG: class I SAM-dependent methyltransferase [Nanoarchaeota archaeon]
MNYYDEISSGYNELHKEEQLKKIKIIIKELNITNEMVLDVGCGTAFYSDLFKDYTGIDNSEGMLEKANSNVILGNAEELPFEDDSFDIVISVTALHNVKGFKKAIKEMERVSKGKIAISVLKKSKHFDEIKKELKDYKQIEEEKDIIFIKKH